MSDLKKSNKKIARAIKEYSESEVAIIRNTVAKGTTDLELAYFLNVAKSVNLNPFVKEIWCYKDKKGNLLVFAGRDGFLAAAQKSSTYAGIRSSEVRENDEFSLDIANNKITHNIKIGDRGKIVGAYAIAFRKGGEPTIEWAEFAAYNKGFNAWQTHPADMIKKVAETHALKKAFGVNGIQSEYDFELENNTVHAINTSETVQLQPKNLKKLSDEEFEMLIDNSDEFILRHKDNYDFSESQRESLAVRFSEDE